MTVTTKAIAPQSPIHNRGGIASSSRKKTVSRDRRRSSVTTSRIGWSLGPAGIRVLLLGQDRPPPAHRAQHDGYRCEAENDVHDRGRDLHADAEAEQGSSRDPRSPEDVDDEPLLCPDSAGREGEEGREALDGQYENRVADRSRHMECLQEEVDASGAQEPARGLPGHDAREEAQRLAEDGEPLPEPLPKLLPALDADHDKERDHRRPDEAHDEGRLRVLERPVP